MAIQATLPIAVSGAIVVFTACACGNEIGSALHHKAYWQGPLCGIDCVQHALRSIDGGVPSLEELFDPKYVTSLAGSSGADLVRAVRDAGEHAEFFVNWGILHLQLVASPTILHVASTVPGVYDHWVLYLGHGSGGGCRIYDSASGLEEWTVSDLLARWDGSGVIVMRSKGEGIYSGCRDAVVVRALVGLTVLAVLAAVVGTALLLLRIIRAVHRSNGLAVLAAAILAAVASCACCTWCGGLACDHEALAWLGSRYVSTSLRGISRAELTRLLSSPSTGVILVDARYRVSFDAGHMPNAMSVPINASPSCYRSFLERVGRDSLVVVYCDYPSCQFADIVGNRLRLCGYSVGIYRPGFANWRGLWAEGQNALRT